MLSNRQIASTYKNNNHENRKPFQKGKTYKQNLKSLKKLSELYHPHMKIISIMLSRNKYSHVSNGTGNII
jgi:hypothetical protein